VGYIDVVFQLSPSITLRAAANWFTARGLPAAGATDPERIEGWLGEVNTPPQTLLAVELINSGWVVHSGQIWKRPQAAEVLRLFLHTRELPLAADPQTPSPGEWLWRNGTLYVHAGTVDPNTKVVRAVTPGDYVVGVRLTLADAITLRDALQANLPNGVQIHGYYRDGAFRRVVWDDDPNADPVEEPALYTEPKTITTEDANGDPVEILGTTETRCRRIS
jgi:hypothetical protein